MTTLGKIDSLIWLAVGGIGWVLQSKGQGEASILAIVVGVAGAAGLIAWALLMLIGGHQAPRLTAGVGQVMPSVLRAALLVGFGWLGGFATHKAGVKTEDLAGLISVVIFGAVVKAIKAVAEPLDALRPVAFSKRSIERVYGNRFNVKPSETNMAKVNARNAVHSDPLQIVDDSGSPIENVGGWKRDARRKRLDLIAGALR